MDSLEISLLRYIRSSSETRFDTSKDNYRPIILVTITQKLLADIRLGKINGCEVDYLCKLTKGKGPFLLQVQQRFTAKLQKCVI